MNGPDRLPRTQNRVSQTRSGVAMVEFALILPLLMLIIVATTEISNRIFEQQSLTIAASEAARVSIIPDASFADVRQQAEEIAAKRNLGDIGVSIDPADFDSQPLGTFIRVTVTSDSPGFFTSGLVLSSEMSSSVTMMKER